MAKIQENPPTISLAAARDRQTEKCPIGLTALGRQLWLDLAEELQIRRGGRLAPSDAARLGQACRAHDAGLVLRRAADEALDAGDLRAYATHSASALAQERSSSSALARLGIEPGRALKQTRQVGAKLGSADTGSRSKWADILAPRERD